MDYTRGWAWQQILLNRRLDIRRRRKQPPQTRQKPLTEEEEEKEDKENDDDDDDVILLLEHAPVYTLGRGANEKHLTFLTEEDKDDDVEDFKNRQKLSRNYRQSDSARLSFDRHTIQGMDEILSIQDPNDAVSILLSQISTTHQPVIAPNGVPIYRVERGGEVTFHGPYQLIVYPLFDLSKPPFHKDLHWYLTSIEEVIIQTLQHFNIDNATRDPINTGMYYCFAFAFVFGSYVKHSLKYTVSCLFVCLLFLSLLSFLHP